MSPARRNSSSQSKDDYYGKVHGRRMRLQISFGLGTGWIDHDDFKHKKLFDFFWPTRQKSKLPDGGKSYFLTHSGSD